MLNRIKCLHGGWPRPLPKRSLLRQSSYRRRTKDLFEVALAYVRRLAELEGHEG